MRTISTGDPSTLGTYKEIARMLRVAKAVKFFQDKIDETPNGADEEVLADESQMLVLICSMM